MAILKQREDLPKLEHSCLILMSCFALLEKELKAGVTAGYLDKIATEFINDHGGKPSFLGYSGFKYTICTSINNEVAHGISPFHKVIPDNSIVSLDCGVIYEGLYSDSCQTFIVGEVNERVQELVAASKECLNAGVAQAKAGNRVGDIGFACQQVAQAHNLGNVLELGGHGLGYTQHEEPYIMHSGKKGKGARLFENQIIAIEPMLTLGASNVEFDETPEDGWTATTTDGSWCSQFEHTVLVTKTGPKVLTDIPKALFLS